MSKKRTTPLTPEEVIRKRRQRLYDQEDIRSFFVRLIMMVIVFYVLFGVAFGVTPMKDNDMSPRISSGDLLLYYRLDDKIHIQDVLVFDKNGEQFVGRVVAQGGDTVEVTEDARLKINESMVWENDIFYTTPQYEQGISYPVKLKEDELFVLCDYREGGKDSRSFGPVSREELKGKVITVIRRSGL